MTRHLPLILSATAVVLVGVLLFRPQAQAQAPWRTPITGPGAPPRLPRPGLDVPGGPPRFGVRPPLPDLGWDIPRLPLLQPAIVGRGVPLAVGGDPAEELADFGDLAVLTVLE